MSAPDTPEAEAPAPDAPAKVSATAAFQHRDYLLYWLTRFFGTLSIQMESVAVGWLVYNLTDSAFALGIVGLAQFLPMFGFALVTGHVADRFDRRLILILCYAVEAASAVMLLAFALSGSKEVWIVYLILVMFGTARAFASPAGQAIVPNLVPKAHFANAVAWSSSAWQTATIFGPALGGLVFAFGGAAAAFSACAVLLGICALALMAMRVRLGRAEQKAASWETLLAGLAFIRAKPAIFGAISLDLFAVLFGGATALLPIYAKDILHLDATGLGLLRSAPAVGAAATALLLAWKPLTRNTGAIMFFCVGLFGVATIVFGLSTELWLSLAALVVLGASDMVSVFVRSTLVQISTPDAMRGRVSAVNSIFIGASNELGEFESGLAAAWLGVVPAVVAGGVGTIAVVLLWAWWFPALRKADRLDQAV
ncbi:MAG TPA: MFS transporter [Alphaproteobacteria bacterium]|nr:MFS transporter [Alphaproteobacteria bacterium]